MFSDDKMCQMMDTNPPHLQANSTSSSHTSAAMVNALNGRHPSVTTPDNSNPMSLNSNPDYSFSLPLSDMSMFDSDFFHPLEEKSWGEQQQQQQQRSDSRHSITPVPSPRNSYSHVSPATNPPLTPFTSTSLTFSPPENELQDSKDISMEDSSSINDSSDSKRLRDLLNKPSVEEDANRRQSFVDGSMNSKDESMDLGDVGHGSSHKKPPSSTPSSGKCSNLMLRNVSRTFFLWYSRSIPKAGVSFFFGGGGLGGLIFRQN